MIFDIDIPSFNLAFRVELLNIMEVNITMIMLYLGLLNLIKKEILNAPKLVRL